MQLLGLKTLLYIYIYFFVYYLHMLFSESRESRPGLNGVNLRKFVLALKGRNLIAQVVMRALARHGGLGVRQINYRAL